jgi:hypothetical protein
MTFTEKQQKEHREAFIKECRQKAWSAACHSAWISKNIDELLAHYQKLQAEDNQLQADSKELASALDAHTVDNRDKRKAIQGRRDHLAQNMAVVAKSSQQGRQAMQQLLQSVESALELAKHAETWEWKETEATPEVVNDEGNPVESHTQDCEFECAAPHRHLDARRAKPKGNKIEVVEAPGDLCGNTKKLPDGSKCPGCRACC